MANQISDGDEFVNNPTSLKQKVRLKTETGNENVEIQEDPPGMFVEIKGIIIDRLLQSTAHGFSNIILNNLWVFKLAWICCLTGAFACCGYLIQKTIAEFLDYNVVTTIRKYGDSPVTFPAVSICNSNLVVHERALEYVNNLVVPLDKIMDQYEYLQSYVGISLYSPKYNDTFRASMGFSLDEFVIRCSFKGLLCNNSLHWMWYFDSMYGNCFRFNGGVDASGACVPILKSTKAGRWNGLSLM
jgi:acid-sensing ion channel 1